MEFLLKGVVTAIAVESGAVRTTVTVTDCGKPASYFYVLTDRLKLRQEVEVTVRGEES